MPTSNFDDTPYDPNDPKAVASFWEGATISHKGKVLGKASRGKQKTPVKIPVSIRLSPDVVDHFKSGGEGWQTRLDEALKTYIAEHSKVA